MDAMKLLEQFLEVLNEVPKRYEGTQEAIKQAENITWDLLHEIGLGNHTKPQRLALYKRLRENLKARWSYKNENEALYPLYKALETGAANNLRLDLYKVRKEIEGILQTQAARTYTPKVLENLTIGGKNHVEEG